MTELYKQARMEVDMGLRQRAIQATQIVEYLESQIPHGAHHDEHGKLIIHPAPRLPTPPPTPPPEETRVEEDKQVKVPGTFPVVAGADKMREYDLNLWISVVFVGLTWVCFGLETLFYAGCASLIGFFVIAGFMGYEVRWPTIPAPPIEERTDYDGAGIREKGKEKGVWMFRYLL